MCPVRKATRRNTHVPSCTTSDSSIGNQSVSFVWALVKILTASTPVHNFIYGTSKRGGMLRYHHTIPPYQLCPCCSPMQSHLPSLVDAIHCFSLRSIPAAGGSPVTPRRPVCTTTIVRNDGMHLQYSPDARTWSRAQMRRESFSTAQNSSEPGDESSLFALEPCSLRPKPRQKSAKDSGWTAGRSVM